MMPVIYGNSYGIIQAPGVVAIRYEMIHETRIIPVDDSARPAKSITSYWVPHAGAGKATRSSSRRAVQRARLLSQRQPGDLHAGRAVHTRRTNKVEWSVTIDDPATWTKPWTYSMNLTRDASLPLFEYGCHEGNYGLANILSAARAEEKAAKQK